MSTGTDTTAPPDGGALGEQREALLGYAVMADHPEWRYLADPDAGRPATAAELAEYERRHYDPERWRWLYPQWPSQAIAQSAQAEPGAQPAVMAAPGAVMGMTWPAGAVPPAGPVQDASAAGVAGDQPAAAAFAVNARAEIELAAGEPGPEPQLADGTAEVPETVVDLQQMARDSQAAAAEDVSEDGA